MKMHCQPLTIPVFLFSLGALWAQCDATYAGLKAGRPTAVREGARQVRLLGSDSDASAHLVKFALVDGTAPELRPAIVNYSVLPTGSVSGEMNETVIVGCRNGSAVVLFSAGGSLETDAVSLYLEEYQPLPSDAHCCPSLTIRTPVVFSQGAFKKGAPIVEWVNRETEQREMQGLAGDWDRKPADVRQLYREYAGKYPRANPGDFPSLSNIVLLENGLYVEYSNSPNRDGRVEGWSYRFGAWLFTKTSSLSVRLVNLDQRSSDRQGTLRRDSGRVLLDIDEESRRLYFGTRQ